MRLRHHTTLQAPTDDSDLITASVGPDHGAIALWRRRQDPDRLVVTRHGPDAPEHVEIEDPGFAQPLLQPLPDGRVLIADARCPWTEDGPVANARVLDAEGTTVASATLGDGIEHLLTTSDGQVWVGYFDEGIHGGMGWGPAGREPLGASGLRRFDSELNPTWSFPGGKDAAGIEDCYALNVSDEAAWVYYYADFPVCRVDGTTGQVESWPTPVPGARAVLADEDGFAIVGGYGRARDRVVQGVLADGAFTPVGATGLTLPEGGTAPDVGRTVARGNELHVFHGRDWFRSTLS